MKLGRYEIVRELGKGAMGVVYLAKDPLIGRLVALKTIRAAAHSDDDETKEFQQRFIREAQAAGILNHPAIVTVHDIGQDESNGTSFIAMEYVEGHNLKELLAHSNALTWEQIADIISQIADALDFAHSKGIVHRDVKPANIILIEGGRAKITDFGIAKIASGAANLTTTGQFLGTPNYMAPEQIKGTPVDGRTDIFSLGICLYECLTRRKPFGGDSLTSISYKIVHESFAPLRDINPEIPEAFEDIVAKCLAKDPSKRFQRGRDLAAALRSALRPEAPKPEPVPEEETVITRDGVRDGSRIPTIEVPFPEAEVQASGDPLPNGLHAAPAGAGAMAMTEAVPIPQITPAPARARGGPDFSRLIRNTVTNMRAYPMWQRRIPPAIFLAVVAVLIVGLLVAVAAIQSRRPTIPKVDVAAEMRVEKQRQLRAEGNDLLTKGNVDGAYDKFSELHKLAPNSPAINTLLQKLSAIRTQQEVSKKQLELAKQKYEQGVAAYNAKNYQQAIDLLQESFTLNPEPEATKAYLQLAQQQLVMQAQLQQARQNPVQNPAVVVTQTSKPVAVAGPPAALNTVFDSPFSDGYIMVKAGGEVVAHENLWEEKGRFFRRQYPRVVNVTHAFPAKIADVEVWVIVPSQKIEEHRVLRQAFSPGTQHKLLVSFDQASKKFSYQLN